MTNLSDNSPGVCIDIAKDSQPVIKSEVLSFGGCALVFTRGPAFKSDVSLGFCLYCLGMGAIEVFPYPGQYVH